MHLSAASIRRRLLFAPLAQHRGRTLLAVVAIALGVALGYAVQLINQVAVNEFTQAVGALSGDADLEVSGPRGGFDETLYARLARLPEVAVASPVLELDARVAGRREALKVLGLDVFRAGLVQPELVLSESANGIDFLRDDRIFLSQSAADWLHLGPGDEIGLQVGLAEVRLIVAGILRGESLRQRLGVMDIAAAQWRLERLGAVNRIDLRLRPGENVDAFARSLAPTLPPGLLVERPRANVERSANLSRAYRTNLNVLALVALFTGGLLVFSTQALAVVQRRAQLALLRVLGLTRRGLLVLLIGETVLIGAVGALAGIAIGHMGAEFAVAHFGADLGAGQFRGIQPELRVDAWGLALFALLGIVTAVAGSLAPALEAARAAPAQALKAGDEQRVFERLRPVRRGAILIVAGIALTQAPPVFELPLFGYVAIGCLLVGTIALMPCIAAACFGSIPHFQAPATRLAVAQLAGAPGQAMVSLAAIVASVSLMVSMAIMVTSFRHSLEDWLDRVLPADLYVRTGPQNEAAFLSADEQQRLRDLAGVRRAEFLRSQQVLLAPERPQVMVFAREIDRSEAERFIALVGPHISPGPQDPPPLWASEAMMDLYGYRVGNIVELPLGGRSERFTVAGIWRDYARQQGSVIIERDVYVRVTGDRNANDAAIWLAREVAPARVRQAITASIADPSRMDIFEPGEIRENSLKVFDRTFAVTYALEAVAVVIGLFGLASSFGALVLARSREFGMLRHVGMTRRQIAAMLATEGALVSALGLAIGIALGWLISLVLIHVVNRQSFHWSMDLHLPWGDLAAFTVVMLAFSVLTALASGRRAMSREVVLAVKEDW